MRILAQPRGGISDSDALEHFDRPLAGRSAIQPTVHFERLGHLPTDRQNGVQGRHRLLEDHADAVAPKASPRLLIKAEDIVLLERDGTVVTRADRGSRPMIDRAVTLLPDPLSPTRATVSPMPTVERNLGHDGSRVAMAKGNRQRGYFQQRSRSSATPMGIHRLADGVAEKVEREHDERDRKAGVEHQPGSPVEEVTPGRTASRPTPAPAAALPARGSSSLRRPGSPTTGRGSRRRPWSPLHSAGGERG